MVGSLTAMATIVVSDIAEAGSPPEVQVQADAPEPKPVKMSKVDRRAELDLDSLDELQPVPVKEPPRPRAKKKRAVDFGRFEGY